MTIGLKRETVKLVEYQEEWNEAARECIRMLCYTLGRVAVAIEHVGSTAILGIHAKPMMN